LVPYERGNKAREAGKLDEAEAAIAADEMIGRRTGASDLARALLKDH
jgi:hypothetical protein